MTVMATSTGFLVMFIWRAGNFTAVIRSTLIADRLRMDVTPASTSNVTKPLNNEPLISVLSECYMYEIKICFRNGSFIMKWMLKSFFVYSINLRSIEILRFHHNDEKNFKLLVIRSSQKIGKVEIFLPMQKSDITFYHIYF